MQKSPSRPSCDCQPEECEPVAVPRRDFMKFAGLGAAVATFGGLPVMAGPFNASDVADRTIATVKVDDEKVAFDKSAHRLVIKLPAPRNLSAGESVTIMAQ